MPADPSDESDNAHSVVRRGSLSDEEDEDGGRGKKSGILAAPATLATSGNGRYTVSSSVWL